MLTWVIATCVRITAWIMHAIWIIIIALIVLIAITWILIGIGNTIGIVIQTEIMLIDD